MKKKIETSPDEETAEPKQKIISRKEALKKTAYIAVSAATMMILLSNPQRAIAAVASPPAPPPPFG